MGGSPTRLGAGPRMSNAISSISFARDSSKTSMSMPSSIRTSDRVSTIVGGRGRGRQRSVLMADLERLLWLVKARPGDQGLGMVVTDDITVGAAIRTGLGSRYKL